MSFEVPATFGYIERYQKYWKQGKLELIVVEKWKYRRWILLYSLQDKEWVVSSRFALCGPIGSLSYIHQSYGCWEFCGPSVDFECLCVVVEKKDTRLWLITYEVEVEGPGYWLVDEVEFDDLIPVDPPALALAREEESYAVEASLVEVLPVMADICDVQVVSTASEQLAFVTEGFGCHRRLFLYKWIN